MPELPTAGHSLRPEPCWGATPLRIEHFVGGLVQVKGWQRSFQPSMKFRSLR
jgi:hypothetical protein